MNDSKLENLKDSKRYVRPRVIVTQQPIHPILIANYNANINRFGIFKNPTALNYLSAPTQKIDFSKDTLGSIGFLAFVQSLNEPAILQITHI